MTHIRSSARLVAICMMLSTVALPAHALSLPDRDENIWAGARPDTRPVGLAATERAPRVTVRPPLRGEVPLVVAQDTADEVSDEALEVAASEPSEGVAELAVAEPAGKAGEPRTAEPKEAAAQSAAGPAVVIVDLAAAEPEELDGEPVAATVKEAEQREVKTERSDPFEDLLFATSKGFEIEPSALDEVLVAEHEAKRLEDEGVVDYAALRDYVLPEDLIWRAPETPSQQAARQMKNAIRERLSSRYDLENGASGDIERFHAIAEGQSLKDWGTARPAVVGPAAMKVVETRFEAPAPVAPPVAPKSSDLRGFLNSPAGLAALSQMDAAQISALTAMLREMEGREAPTEKPDSVATAAAPSMAATTKGPGVPALSFRRTAETGGTQGGSTVRTLGSNDNLLLKGWQVMDEDGDVIIYRDDAPGSKIVVRKGMILGALGAVVEVERSEDQVRVRFESGDEIAGATS